MCQFFLLTAIIDLSPKPLILRKKECGQGLSQLAFIVVDLLVLLVAVHELSKLLRVWMVGR